jgi:tetratricopeptide (TPR) repeat protein
VTYVDQYLKRVASQHAGDDAALATEFATTYLRLGEMQGPTPAAVASFENGRRLLERKSSLSAADTLLLARLRARQGSTQLDLRQIPQGVENLTAASSLADHLAKDATLYPEPDLVKAFAGWRLARLHRMQFRLPEAEQQARASIATAEEIVARGFRTKEVFEILTGARNVLGAAERRQGRWREALETYQKVLADTEQRALADPGSASLQREMARSHQILGDMVVRIPAHDEDQVRFHVRSAIAIAERLAALDPSDQTAQSELAQYLSSGAETLRLPEESKEALGYLRRALPMFETLMKSQPGDGEMRLYAALTEADMGEFMGRAHSQTQSILWLRRGMADVAKLVESDPANTTTRFELLKVQEWLSLGLARSGQEAESLALAEDAILKARSLADDVRARPESWREVPRAYAALAATYGALGKRADARKWYRVATVEWEKMIAQGLYFPDTEEEIADARRGAATGAPVAEPVGK